MKTIEEALNWRYATKKFDPSKKIDDGILSTLLEVMRLSPSSYGLQPWKFIIVNNKETREKISVAAYGQPQIMDASHLIVIANKKNIDDSLVDDYIQFISKENGVDVSNLDGFSGMIKGSLSGKSSEGKRAWAAQQAYIAVGVLLTACATLEIDACPMEGFDSSKVDEILNLSSLDLESKAIVTLGYRSEDDSYILHKKIRFPKEEVFVEIN